MVEHVRRRALLSGAFSEVIVATCDQEIREVVEGYGGRCVLTSAAHPGGTDRVSEASRFVECTHAVNIQGDQVLVLPEDLKRMVAALTQEPDVPAWNAVALLSDQREMIDPSVVKCALSASGRIIFCARDFSLGSFQDGFGPLRRVIGVLGFRKEFLHRYGSLPRTPLELAGSIDQCRIIENDVLFKSVLFQGAYPEINEPREVDLTLKYLEEDPLQRSILKEVLSGLCKESFT